MPTLKAIHICNSHQPRHKPKIAKEYVFANADRRQKKKYDRTTKCINHWADSANFKVITFNKICSGLTVKCFEMPNASYTNRWKPYNSHVVGELKHRAITLKRRLTAIQKISTRFFFK